MSGVDHLYQSSSGKIIKQTIKKRRTVNKIVCLEKNLIRIINAETFEQKIVGRAPLKVEPKES